VCLEVKENHSVSSYLHSADVQNRKTLVRSLTFPLLYLVSFTVSVVQKESGVVGCKGGPLAVASHPCTAISDCVAVGFV
jgi:hypothetical protein